MTPYLCRLYARLAPRRRSVVRPLAVLALAVLGALWVHEKIPGSDVVDLGALVVVAGAWAFVGWVVSG